MTRRLPFIAALLLAGTAGAGIARADYSTSIMRPTPVDPATGQIAGSLPGGDGSRSFYLATDLSVGELTAQLAVSGRPGTAKALTIELLDGEARVAQTAYVTEERDARTEKTRALPVDNSGRHILRVTVKGPESGRYCVQLGGSALPSATPAPCPGFEAPQPAPAPQPQPVKAPPAPEPPPAPVQAADTQQGFKVIAGQKAVEVMETRCEQRLKVNADLLFDFDRAALRPQAKPALDLVARMVAERNRPVTIEGHTDSKGSEAYNQALSERRALAVEGALLDRMTSAPAMTVRGFGELRPVVPNELPDGSDDPDGRQKNRRVEVVINTCA
jgi:outer membrane protein OmpA-like peptidoglycan-associated protein